MGTCVLTQIGRRRQRLGKKRRQRLVESVFAATSSGGLRASLVPMQVFPFVFCMRPCVGLWVGYGIASTGKKVGRFGSWPASAPTRPCNFGPMLRYDIRTNGLH